MGVLDALGTDRVFYYFDEITKIPHGSGNEKALGAYILRFAKERGLYARTDEAGNVVVKKPASLGYENAPAVIIQGHLDMVCEKLGDIPHDFTKDPLSLVIDGDFIRAKGTTLGADDGIAVAYALALLDLDTLEHPALEIVLTTEEETGMDGARALDVSDLEGKYFINMDSEEEGKFLISCCGGRRMHISLPAAHQAKPENEIPYLLSIKGLMGGHSGSDIHLGRASANKLMGRLLYALTEANLSYSLASVNGGTMDNAICREANAILTMDAQTASKAETIIKDMEKLLKDEYRHTDVDMILSLEKYSDTIDSVLTEETKKNTISILMLIPFGVESMSLDIEGLVESSSNIGVVRTDDDCIHFDNAVRSSVASRKEALCQKISVIAALCGASVESLNDYPGWINREDAKLTPILQSAYDEITGQKSSLTAIHAGVECGLFAEKMPWLDMVSMGPEMYDVHTPQERLSISSTIRVWEFLKEALRRMK